MKIVKEGEGANLFEIGQVAKGPDVISREFVIYDGNRAFVLTVGTQEYISDLTNLDPEYATEKILVAPMLQSPEIEQFIKNVSELPNFQDLLVEQLIPDEEVVTPQ